MRSNFTEANRLLSGTKDQWTETINSESKKERPCVTVDVTGSKAIILQRISESGHEKPEEGDWEWPAWYCEAELLPEVQLNSIMDTIFCLVLAQGLLKLSYDAQQCLCTRETTIPNNYVSKSTPVMKNQK